MIYLTPFDLAELLLLFYIVLILELGAYKLLIIIDYLLRGIVYWFIVVVLPPVPPVPDLLEASLGLEILLFFELWLALEELRYSKL